MRHCEHMCLYEHVCPNNNVCVITFSHLPKHFPLKTLIFLGSFGSPCRIVLLGDCESLEILDIILPAVVMSPGFSVK